MTSPADRWPRRVYAVGYDPDARFSLANERTYLAWLRTALAFMAAGLALEALDIPTTEWIRQILVVILALLGSLTAILAFLRWAASERALRLNEPLPPPRLAAVLSVILAVASVVVVVTVLVE